MPSFYPVSTGATAQAQDVNQLVNALNGSAGNGVPLAVTAVNDSVNFALVVKNADAINSRSLQVLRANNNVLLQADVNGLIGSPDGGATTAQLVTVSHPQTLSNKTFSTNVTVSTGGLTVTGDSTLTGALSGLTTLTATTGVFGGGTPASAGAVRIPNNTFIAFRNNGNTNNISVGVDTLDRMVFGGGNVLSIATTVGAAGAATALPANPLGYWRVALNGAEVKFPYYSP